MSRRRLLAAAVAAVAVAAGIALVRPDVPGREPLAGYSISYDVTVVLPAGTESGNREVRVRRPFTGLELRTEGPDEAVTGTIGDDGHVLTVQPDAVLDGGEAAPGVPPGDMRFDVVLDDLVRLGLLEEQGSDSVADRACTTYRSGAPLGDVLRPPSPDEYVDWCIDDDGLLLEERWFLDGNLLRTTTATDVDPTPPGASAFDAPGPAPQPSPIASAQRTELPIDEPPAAGGAEYWAAPAGAEGFDLVSRWRVVTSSSATGVPEVRDIAFVDVYLRGTDVVAVEHREAAVAGAPAAGYETVDAGGLGEAEVLVSERGSELQAAPAPWLVTVQGTLGVAELTTFASRLRPVSGR